MELEAVLGYIVCVNSSAWIQMRHLHKNESSGFHCKQRETGITSNWFSLFYTGCPRQGRKSGLWKHCCSLLPEKATRALRRVTSSSMRQALPLHSSVKAWTSPFVFTWLSRGKSKLNCWERELAASRPTGSRMSLEIGMVTVTKEKRAM